MIAIALAVLCCAASALWIDVPLAFWIDAQQNNLTRDVGRFLEEAGKSHWVLGYCVLVVAIAWRSWRDVAHRHIRLFAAVAASGIIANFIKILVCRSRPPLLIEQGIATFDPLGFSTEYLWNSFPSGHATTGFAIAIVGSYAYPRFSLLFWMLGVSISVGRLLYNVHYLSDVIAGGVLGVLVSWYCIEATWLARRKRADAVS